MLAVGIVSDGIAPPTPVASAAVHMQLVQLLTCPTTLQTQRLRRSYCRRTDVVCKAAPANTLCSPYCSQLLRRCECSCATGCIKVFSLMLRGVTGAWCFGNGPSRSTLCTARSLTAHADGPHLSHWESCSCDQSLQLSLRSIARPTRQQ